MNGNSDQTDKSKTGLDEFKVVLGDFRSVAALVAKGALAIPFADLLLRLFDTGISPPWPPGILIITSIAELITLIFIFNFFFDAREKTSRSLMVGLLAILLISFTAYLILFSTYTVNHPKTHQPIILGYTPVNNDIEQAVIDGYTAEQLLSENEFSPSKIWTKGSITVVRVGILFGWMVVFISLSSFIAFFVMLQRKRTSGFMK